MRSNIFPMRKKDNGKRRAWLFCIVVLAVAVVAYSGRHFRGRTGDSLEAEALIGKVAPDFTLQPYLGKAVKLSDFKGKAVVVMDFWATWCQPCQRALPIVSEVCAARKSRGVVLFLIGEGDFKEAPYLMANRIDGIGGTAAPATSIAYRVDAIPEVVVVGKDGIVKDAQVGFSHSEKEHLTDVIERALSEGRH